MEQLASRNNSTQGCQQGLTEEFMNSTEACAAGGACQGTTSQVRTETAHPSLPRPPRGKIRKRCSPFPHFPNLPQ